MSTFFYRAVTANGKVQTGTVAGDDGRMAARELQRQGLTPVYIGASKQVNWSLNIPKWKSGRLQDVLHFTEETATLLNAGIPIDRGLSIVAEMTERPEFRGVVNEVLRSIRSGKSFAESLGEHPAYFSELYISMIRAGEVSGSLALVMDRLALFERARDELRGYIVSSLTYPALLIVVACTSIFIILRYVVPRFAEAFDQSSIQMPLPMQMLMNVSDAIKTFGIPAALLVVIGIIAFRVYIKNPAGRLEWDKLKLRVPLLGDALRKADTARFARAMATLVGNGVPLVQSLTITKGILGNRVLSGALEPIGQGVKRGEGLSVPFKKSGVFPTLAGHLLTVGEETGHLDRMFDRMADIYDKDTREAIKRFTALFEPIVILIMGIIVGAMILSIMLAITSINQIGL
ncbi:MAG TPA: type II secretion system F family protein [Bryobacterales bacterium]|nr:type II secretion system F family protein [Bryobacterales bacterium]